MAQAGHDFVVGGAVGSGRWSLAAARTSRNTAKATRMKLTTAFTNNP